MIILYVKTGCPFSAKAMAALDAYGVEYETRNIKNPEYLAELLELGGKKQTPFFVEDEIRFYESDLIVSHVETHYGKSGDAASLRVHTTDAGVCE
jgi:glutathione S-transferase